MSQILSEHWVLFRRQWEYLRNINTGIELATLSSKNSVSGISKVVYSRRSDRGTPQRDVRRRKKKKTPRGWGRGESEGTRSPLSPSFPPYFCLALFLRAVLLYPHAWNRLLAKILRGSLEAACCDLVMVLKFPTLTHLPCEACTITIMIKIITIIILKLIIIIIIIILIKLMIESFIKKWLKSLSGFNRALYNVKIKIDKILKKLKNLALKQDNQVNNERQITSQVPQAHE